MTTKIGKPPGVPLGGRMQNNLQKGVRLFLHGSYVIPAVAQLFYICIMCKEIDIIKD